MKIDLRKLGFTTRKEFVRDAVRWRLKLLNEEYEFVSIPKNKYDRLELALKEMSTIYHCASDFIDQQIDEVIGKYDRWLEEKGQYDKR